jgi:hypothetical protein
VRGRVEVGEVRPVRFGVRRATLLRALPGEAGADIRRTRLVGGGEVGDGVRKEEEGVCEVDGCA